MIETIWPYLADLHAVVPNPWVGIMLVFCSILCGLVIGLEREVKNKPAGLKTVTLICVGSTAFTLASLLMASTGRSDPGRIAAQIIPGIGFLGAGAILRDRGTIIGLTTGATIWTVAAIGMLIGQGYAVAGIVLTLVVLAMLTEVRHLEHWLRKPCQLTTARIIFQPTGGKAFLHILRILDDYSISDRAWQLSRRGDLEVMDIQYCHYHREHRDFLLQVCELPEVVEIEADRSAKREDESGERLAG